VVEATLRDQYLAACDSARAKVNAANDATVEPEFTAEERAANAMYDSTRMGSCKTALGVLETREWVDLTDKKIQYDGFFPLLARARTLLLAGNGLTSVEGLKGLKGLRDLSLSRNPVTSIAPLGELQWLENLALSEVNLSEGGLTALVRCGALRRLSLRGARMSTSDLRVVGSLSQLRDLDLSESKLATGSGADPADSEPFALLANLTNLERLEIAKAGVKTLDFSARWVKIKELVAPGNAIVSLPASARWNALETLVLAENPIASLGAADELPRAPNLSTIILKATRVRDVSPLKRYGDSVGYLNYERTPAESQKCPFTSGDVCEN
jgi:Leucine-rich repeat (LRR) protein